MSKNIENVCNQINEFLSDREAEFTKEKVIARFIINDNDEIMEESTIVSTTVGNKISKYNIAIGVFGDGTTNRGFINDPYFKIFDGRTFDSSANKVRIAIYRAEYIKHLGQKWNLNSKYKKALMKILKYPYEDKTIWDIVLQECIDTSERPLSDDEKAKLLATPMPDYTQLKDIK